MKGPARRAALLGLVGGYVDTAGFLMLRGLFPNHVTGNLPLAIAHPGRQSIPALAMVPLWLVAVAVTATAAGHIGRDDATRALPALLWVEAAFLGLFVVCGAALIPDARSSTLWTQALVAGAGVCAMATQSVATRLGGYPYPTTMVTGTLTLLGMDAARAAFGVDTPAERAVVLGRLKALGTVVVAFAAGAGIGGLATARVHFWAVALPLAAVAVCARDASGAGGDDPGQPAPAHEAVAQL
jgi:uncharacterized membrane protein YoaK (UPF0700 family)